MAPESDKLIMSSLNKNYIDIDEYFITTELQIRTSQSVDKSNVGVSADACGTPQTTVYCALH